MWGNDVTEREFLGLYFAEMDETGALKWVLERARAKSFSYVVTPNVDHVVQIHRDPEHLNPIYRDAQLRLCDSRVIALMGRWNRVNLPVVTGSGLTARLLSKPLPTGTRIAVVGGNDHQRAWLTSTQPDAQFVFHSPPMGLRRNLEAQTAAAVFVEEAMADIVLITVGAPQSELIANLIHKRGRARGVALCVGASVEFITGEKRRAPRWIQAIAMEWAFRLLSEPRRLARRYLIDGPRVFSIWMKWMKTPEKAPPRPLATPGMPGNGSWEIGPSFLVDAMSVDAAAYQPAVEPASIAAELPLAGPVTGSGLGSSH